MAKAELNFGELGGGTKIVEISGTPSQARIECGFPPRKIMIFDSGYYGSYVLSIYWTSGDSTFKQIFNGTYSTPNVASDQQLYNIDATGFNLPFYTNYRSTAYIVAIE